MKLNWTEGEYNSKIKNVIAVIFIFIWTLSIFSEYLPSRCDFDRDLCGWSNVSLGGIKFLPWTRHSNDTDLEHTGPSGDHTTSTGTLQWRIKGGANGLHFLSYGPVSNNFITARIRRMGKGNVFSLFTIGGGVPQSQVLSKVSGPRSIPGCTPVLAGLGTSWSGQSKY